MSDRAPAIRAAGPGDLPAVRDLLGRTRLPADGLAAHLETVLVARGDGRIVGCAALELYADGALLRSVAVAPERQGEGLGVRLTRAALALARARGAPRVYLLTETAAGFFPRFGFRTIDRAAVAPGVQQSVEYTTVCPVSAQVMMLDLAQAPG